VNYAAETELETMPHKIAITKQRIAVLRMLEAGTSGDGARDRRAHHAGLDTNTPPFAPACPVR
jgi:hypothetical protein